jgi:hypothetical protein
MSFCQQAKYSAGVAKNAAGMAENVAGMASIQSHLPASSSCIWTTVTVEKAKQAHDLQ